jgi:hypothetical protein
LQPSKAFLASTFTPSGRMIDRRDEHLRARERRKRKEELEKPREWQVKGESSRLTP